MFRNLTLLLILAAAAPAAAQVDARMFRQPAVSADKIAFVYAGDIWLVPKTGGTATRLSSPLGEESFPRFSPDGRMLASRCPAPRYCAFLAEAGGGQLAEIDARWMQPIG